MKIGILGSGIVGQTLAKGLYAEKHDIILGTNNKDKKLELENKLPGISITSFEETASKAEILILAVKGTAAENVLNSCGSNIDEKIILDATNPIADAPVQDGVLSFYTQSGQSQMQNLQHKFPEAKFVKAFNSVGAGQMVHPKFKEGLPTMFICGNDAKAKQIVTELINALGWEVEDCGTATAAASIESLCILWCIPGFRENRWTHAFKLLK